MAILVCDFFSLASKQYMIILFAVGQRAMTSMAARTVIVTCRLKLDIRRRSSTFSRCALTPPMTT